MVASRFQKKKPRSSVKTPDAVTLERGGRRGQWHCQ